MILSTYKCDVCGTLKKESNHWWCAEVWYSPDGNGFKLEPFGAYDRSHEGYLHLCGSACVTAKLNEFMSGGKTEAGNARAT